MTKPLDTLDSLLASGKDAFDRANHHAKQVAGVVAAAGSYIQLIKAPGTDIETNGRNVRWFKTAKGRYALVYTYRTGAIELRDRSQQGRVLGSFTNDNIADMWPIFSQL
jgi:hypothetical protein